MALANPVGLLCHPQQSALVFRTVGRLLCSYAGTDESSRSGPVRYVRKRIGWSSPEELPTGLWDDESHGYAKTDKEKRNATSPRQRGENRKSSSNSNSSQATVSSTQQSKSITKLKPTKDGMEQNGSQNVAHPVGQSELVPRKGRSLGREDSIAGRYTMPACVEELQAGKSRQQTTDEDESTAARNYAITLLARGPQTEANLRSKLMRRKVPSQVIDETIEELQRCGLQSDEEYTEVFARSRWKDNTWGPLRIKHELVKKGISKETVEAGLVNLFQKSDCIIGNQDDEDDCGKWSMSTEAAEHLINQARCRWAQGDMEINVRRRRLIGWLQRRGFNWSIISDILKIVESESSVV